MNSSPCNTQFEEHLECKKIDPLEIWTTIEDAVRDVLRASPMEYKFEDDPFLIFQRILSHSKIFFNEDHNTKEKKTFLFSLQP